jgi:hypothetical protein
MLMHDCLIKSQSQNIKDCIKKICGCDCTIFNRFDSHWTIKICVIDLFVKIMGVTIGLRLTSHFTLVAEFFYAKVAVKDYDRF